MNKKIIAVCFMTLVLGTSSFAQIKPFEKFRDAVKQEKGGFAGNKENLSKVFNEERIKLGARFETELWTYLENDPDKLFWISSFLTAKSYLHGNEPLPELGFKIRTRALELLKNRNDKRSLGRQVTIYRHLSVSSKLAGRQDDAIRFRYEAEAILSKHDDLGAYISGRSEYDSCVYENVTGGLDKCDPNPPPKETIVSAGWMNNRAHNFSNPEYPATSKEPNKSSRVDVKIITDVNGNVISAEILHGPVELHDAALDAARKLRFPPTRLSGVPTKVSGWVSYDFRP